MGGHDRIAGGVHVLITDADAKMVVDNRLHPQRPINDPFIIQEVPAQGLYAIDVCQCPRRGHYPG